MKLPGYGLREGEKKLIEKQKKCLSFILQFQLCSQKVGSLTSFLFASSDESSWNRANDLLFDVASHGENTGFEVPCLIVAAKDDKDSFTSSIQHSTRVNNFAEWLCLSTRH